MPPLVPAEPPVRPESNSLAVIIGCASIVRSIGGFTAHDEGLQVGIESTLSYAVGNECANCDISQVGFRFRASAASRFGESSTLPVAGHHSEALSYAI